MTAASIFEFQLYVAGDAQNAAKALANLTAICRAVLPERHVIEIIDVFKDPARALREGIFMTPTLLRVKPGPICRIVGTLSDVDTVVLALGLGALAA